MRTYTNCEPAWSAVTRVLDTPAMEIARPRFKSYLIGPRESSYVPIDQRG